ncbi:hypothetical protein PV367_47795, partial [Streptomyces europaeiscabiei]|nr:hypothetical protein [Streptomyces europaeiscabiei]
MPIDVSGVARATSAAGASGAAGTIEPLGTTGAVGSTVLTGTVLSTGSGGQPRPAGPAGIPGLAGLMAAEGIAAVVGAAMGLRSARVRRPTVHGVLTGTGGGRPPRGVRGGPRAPCRPLDPGHAALTRHGPPLGTTVPRIVSPGCARGRTRHPAGA